MQQPCGILVVLDSVGYRKKPVYILALFFLPFVSQNSGEAIVGGGNGVKERAMDMKANKNDLLVNCGLSCFISEETGSTTITKNPKSPLFIWGVNLGPSTITLLFRSSGYWRKRILPEGLCKTKITHILYLPSTTSLCTGPQELYASENSCPLFQTRTNKKTVV